MVKVRLMKVGVFRSTVVKTGNINFKANPSTSRNFTNKISKWKEKYIITKGKYRADYFDVKDGRWIPKSYTTFK